MRRKNGLKQRQKVLLIAMFVLFLVGAAVINVSPTLKPFIATPDPGTDPVTVIRVSAYHTPSTVYSNMSVVVKASYSTQILSADTDMQFVTSEIAIFRLYYRVGSLNYVMLSMSFDTTYASYVGIIPQQQDGKTVQYYVEVTVLSYIGTSNVGSYYVSAPPPPPEEPPPTEPNLQDNKPPIYIINDVVSANGPSMTWSEFLSATVSGTIYLSVTFVEGGNHILLVELKATNLATGLKSYYSFGHSMADYYTWILEWDTTQVANGEYAMELRMAMPVGGGSEDIVHTVMSAFDFGDGKVTTTFSIGFYIVIVISFVAVLGTLYYRKSKIIRRKR